MKDIWKRVSSIGLAVALVATLLMSFPLVSAPPSHPCEPWPECKGGGEEPPADPAIAFYQSGRKGDRLMVMNEDGSNQASIYEGSFDLWGPFSWSPDGGSITWLSHSNYEFAVWRIDVTVVDGEPQGSNLQLLVGDDDCYLGANAAWSPLGDEIVFVSGDRTSNNWWIKSVPAEGGPTTTVYAGNEIGINIKSLSWNSAGTHIAFIETDIDTAERYIRIIERATGIVTHTLVKGQYNLFGLDWARQGVDKIAFDDTWTGTIRTIDISTGTIEPVTAGKIPSWSPDNSHIAFLKPAKKQALSKIELDTGEITQLASGVWQGWRRF